MSLLDSTDYNSVDLSRPVFDRQVLRCTITDVSEGPHRSREGVTLVTVKHALAQTAKATNGKEYSPGFTFLNDIGIMAETNGTPLTDGQRTANRISTEQMKRLICAGLKVPIDTKDVGKLLIEAGGWSALNGREVLVTVAARPDKNDASRVYQDVKSYAAVPSDAPSVPAVDFPPLQP